MRMSRNAAVAAIAVAVMVVNVVVVVGVTMKRPAQVAQRR